MPIYEYRCNSCHDEFEVTQKITDAPLAACPKCDGAVEKLISHSSFVLKGSGWYATDYGKKSGGPEKPAASEGATACGASGSKPACASCPSASS